MKNTSRSRETSKKFMSLLLSVLFVFSGITIFDTFVETVVADEGVPELQITGLGTEGPVAYLNQNNRLVLTIANQGTADAINVVAEIWDVIPNQNETLIKSLHFGAVSFDELKKNSEKTRYIDWEPTERGIHYIKVELSGKYLTHNSPAELVESPPVTMSAGFPVTLAGPEETWGPGGQGAGYHDDIVVSSNRYRDGPLTIFIKFGNLEILSGATLQLNESVTLVMTQLDLPTRRDITIQSGAKFIIDSPTNPTTLQSSLLAKEDTFPFHNNGTLDFTGADVTYTYGDPVLTNPGGIQNYANSVCNLTDCNIELADTHSIIADNSTLNIDGNTLVGKQLASATTNQGTGITIKGNSAAVIDGITADYNEEYGIKCVNTGNQVRIENGATIRNGKTHGIGNGRSPAALAHYLGHF